MANESAATTAAAALAFERLSGMMRVVSSADGANEATTRLRAIDTLLFEVLGWDRSAVEAEKYCRAVGFADYVLTAGGVKALVVEAKREGATFVLPRRDYSSDAVGFSMLAKECSAAADALRQAAGYANTLGARYVAITNGHQWLLALTHVDGEEIDQRSVLVWESTEAITARFFDFYTSLGPADIAHNTPSDKLFEPRRKPAPTKLSAHIPNYPVPANRNVIVNELSVIVGIVWDGLAHSEASAQFLSECYVTPNESEASLRLAAELLAEHRERDLGAQARVIPATKAVGVVAEGAREKPILVLGRVGHGKTTFLRYLRLVEANKVLKGYCQMEVDFLDRPDKATEVPAFVYDSLEGQLRDRFRIDITEDRTVRGILDSDLARFRKTPRGVAFPKDSSEYKTAEIEFIEGICRDRSGFLRRAVRHLQAGQGKSIAIFFDNLDRRDDDIQEEAFLRASAIAREWNCLVFVCLRPSTFYRSRRDGVLDAIAPKTLSVSAPDPSVLLKKRLEFAIKIARGEDLGIDLRMGTGSGAVGFDLKTVPAFLECCRDSFWTRKPLIELLEAASNGNTRDLLRLVQEVLTCNHLNTRKILQHEASRYRIPTYELVRCLLYRDDLQYSPGRSCFLNLFDIEHSDKREHFGRLLLISLLQRAGAGSASGGYVTVDDVTAYMGQHGYSAAYSRRTAMYLYDRQCLEGRVHGAGWDQVQAVRTTSLGRYLVNHLTHTFDYIDAVVIDTPIIDDEVRSRIVDVSGIQERVDRAIEFLGYLKECSKSLHDNDARSTWDAIEADLHASIAEVRRSRDRGSGE